jgi:hypothetical protein
VITPEVVSPIVPLSLAGIWISIVVGLRQLGIIRHLPDLSGPVFQANAVTTSPAAYPLGALRAR